MCGWFLFVVMRIIGLDRCCAGPHPLAIWGWRNTTGKTIPTLAFEPNILPTPPRPDPRASSSRDAKSKALPASTHHPKRTQPKPAPDATDPSRPHPPKRTTPPMEPPSSTTRVCGSSTQPEPVPPLTKALKKTQAGHEQPHAVATNLTGPDPKKTPKKAPPAQFQAVPPPAGPKAAQHTTSCSSTARGISLEAL